ASTRPGAGCCSCCAATRAAASAWWRSCGPTPCRTPGATRSTPTSTSDCPWTPAPSRPCPASSSTSGSGRSGCSPTTRRRPTPWSAGVSRWRAPSTSTSTPPRRTSPTSPPSGTGWDTTSWISRPCPPPPKESPHERPRTPHRPDRPPPRGRRQGRHGSPAPPNPHQPGTRLAIVAATGHEQVMDGLLAGALRGAGEAGIAEPAVVRAPGSFELPVLADALARDHDAVVALGVVIRGGTPHFEYVCSAATDGLTRVALDHGIPVGFGLLTCDDEQQALDRAGLPGSVEDKGHEAAAAALTTAHTLAELAARSGDASARA